MQMTGRVQRMTIYFGESDRWQGKPLYMALLETLRGAGLAGATVTRAVAGFGAHSRIKVARLADLSADLPMIIEVVDTPERLAHALDTVGPMVTEGLITLEDVTVVKYTHRYAPRLPDNNRVSDIMVRDVAVAQPATPIHAVVQLLLDRRVKAVPVVDSEHHVVGIITGGDLLRRGGLPVRLSLVNQLPPDLKAHHLQVLEESGRVAGDIMTPQPVTIRQDAPLSEAMDQMVRRQLKRLPVTDYQGRLVGLVSRIEILRAIAAVQEAQPAPPPPTGLGLQVREVMISDVPTARPETPLDEILPRLVASPLRRVVIVGATNHVQGLITDATLLEQAASGAKTTLWASVRHALGLGEPTPARSDLRAEDVMLRQVVTIVETASVLDAIGLMVETHIKRLVVVDQAGRLVGMLGRQRALQAVTGEAPAEE
ncbi:MAG: DUF190 domain-containing protein [Anaerolineae bacterium]|nr:DUF190 domain-containing protein [Anaerolineae bacterium]